MVASATVDVLVVCTVVKPMLDIMARWSAVFDVALLPHMVTVVRSSAGVSPIQIPASTRTSSVSSSSFSSITRTLTLGFAFALVFLTLAS